MRVLRFLGGLAIAVSLAAGAAASERKPLPAFSVKSTSGADVGSAALPFDATWLLVVVKPRCTPCDDMLSRIEEGDRAATSRVVVIGAGMDPASVEALAAAHPNMSASQWLADPDGVAFQPLELKALPTAFGLRGRMMEWRLAGGDRNGRELKSILFTWLENR